MSYNTYFIYADYATWRKTLKYNKQQRARAFPGQLLKLTTMGAINYGTSEFICNLGYNLNNDVENYEEAQDDQRWTAEEVQEYLNDICLSFYKIDLIPGYYEGFYLDIRGDYYADDEDKQERAEELHKIGRALIHLVNYCGLVNYTPGWCTGYATTDNTIRAIKNAVKKEITEIYNTPKTAKIYA